MIHPRPQARHNHEPESNASPAPEAPDLLASDAERDRHAEWLREHAAQGRIAVEELSQRLDRAYAARTRRELAALVRDLPAIPAPRERGEPEDRGRRELRGHLISFVLVNLLLVGIWAMTGGGYFWPVWSLLGWGVGLVAHASEAFLSGSRLAARSRRGPRT